MYMYMYVYTVYTCTCKLNINCHLHVHVHVLYKTDYGCSTVLNLRLLRVEEQEETLVNINTLLNFHMCLYMRMTQS